MKETGPQTWTANASSTNDWDNHDFHPSYAIDGIEMTTIDGCWHHGDPDNPGWLQIDLGGTYYVGAVELVNRMDMEESAEEKYKEVNGFCCYKSLMTRDCKSNKYVLLQPLSTFCCTDKC